MNADVVLLPSQLTPNHLIGRSCVVFDVLRATTTMAYALAAGVREIRLFDSLDAAQAAAGAFAGARLLCGESNCLPPPGFDLGNSPGQFQPAHCGATVFMCTTNGTRALLSAWSAAGLYTGALVNASAVARRLREDGRDAVLLCAGTNGAVAMEDMLGAGAILDALAAEAASDGARIALSLFLASRDRLSDVLRDTEGGRNVLAAGLPRDIEFAARLDALDVVGVASGDPLVVRASTAAG
ncbi:MAG: 2-phosphosulfolactate phosphatase [Tepidisphaeraceae bacterium]